MPSISSGKVLVTGANGFIAAHCVAKLLLSGFSVIGTVRSEAKAQSVLRSHSNHPSLSLIIVEDVTQPGCFDTAIAGCDAVLHLAAPFGYVYSNFETELLIPSINGTLRICEAAQTAKSVKRVVLTSSFASVYDASKGRDPGKTYTEDDWCPLSYEDGKNASAAPIAYRASKVLAEKTAWNFIASNEVAWDLVTLCPGMVFGQLLPGTIGSLKELNTSNGIVWSLFDAKDVPDTKAPSRNLLSRMGCWANLEPVWTSITSLATAHLKALTTATASNQRFLIVDGEYDMHELAKILHASKLPDSAKERIPGGKVSASLGGAHYKVNNEKAHRILDLETRSLEETIVPLVEQLLEIEKL